MIAAIVLSMAGKRNQPGRQSPASRVHPARVLTLNNITAGQARNLFSARHNSLGSVASSNAPLTLVTAPSFNPP